MREARIGLRPEVRRERGEVLGAEEGARDIEGRPSRARVGFVREEGEECLARARAADLGERAEDRGTKRGAASRAVDTVEPPQRRDRRRAPEPAEEPNDIGRAVGGSVDQLGQAGDDRLASPGQLGTRARRIKAICQ